MGAISVFTGINRKTVLDVKRMSEKISYVDFLNKTKTYEKCPICNDYYFNHVGTGREYLCTIKKAEGK